MTFEEIKNKIISSFGAEIILAEQAEQLQASICISAEHLQKLCSFLRDEPELYFDYLNCLSGVDYGIDKSELAVVYHLSSIPYKHQLVIKVMIPFDRTSATLPSIPSVSSIWRSADWHEREAFDMYGIQFEGHPDMRRILCPDDWEGFPLRKDYEPAELYNGLKIKFDRDTTHD